MIEQIDEHIGSAVELLPPLDTEHVTTYKTHHSLFNHTLWMNSLLDVRIQMTYLRETRVC